jgi:hypothetical protein
VNLGNKERQVGWFQGAWHRAFFKELEFKDAIRHTISDDMEILEIDTPREVTIIPLKQIKYFSCDAGVFVKQKAET